MVPITLSAHTYAYATLGEFVAWIIGWDLIIEYAVGNVAVAISWGNHFKGFISGFNIVIPDWLSSDYRTAAHIPGLLESAPHRGQLVVRVRHPASAGESVTCAGRVSVFSIVCPPWRRCRGTGRRHEFSPGRVLNGWMLNHQAADDAACVDALSLYIRRSANARRSR